MFGGNKNKSTAEYWRGVCVPPFALACAEQLNMCACQHGHDWRGCSADLWLEPGLGYYGEANEWKVPLINFQPNPVECLWVGPNMSDFDCSSCHLGYETTSADNATCTKPEFRPAKRWAASLERAQLVLQDARGATVEHNASINTSVLRTGRMYTIPAPQLEPKERKFVGYKQPYQKIHYELDFSLGADVDIGCGTAVVGNGAGDANIPKSVFTHPDSMHHISYQWMVGRGDLKADPPDPGFYPQRCPRFHRFKVTRAGNFTFVRSICPAE